MSGVRVLHADDEAEVVHGAGDVYRFLATGADTNGGYFIVEATVPPGGGPPIPAMATYHPAYLLRQSLQKRAAWRDFLTIRQRLEEAG